MEVLATVLLLAAAGALQGFLGFGFGIFAMGTLSLLHDPGHAAGVVNIVGLVQCAGLAVGLRKSIEWPLVARVLPGALVGIALGLLLLERLAGPQLLRALGVLIIAFALWSLLRPPAAPRAAAPGWDAPVGFASGLLTGLFNTGGPPLILYVYRRPGPPESLIGTLQALFVGSALIRLPAAAGLGMLTAAIWRDAAISVPLALAGVALGRSLGRHVPAERFRRASWLGLGLLGAWILVTA